VVARLPEAIPLALADSGLSFLPPGGAIGLVVLGIAIGTAAAGFAVRRFLARLA
jgi:hypothetical protein